MKNQEQYNLSKTYSTCRLEIFWWIFDSSESFYWFVKNFLLKSEVKFIWFFIFTFQLLKKTTEKIFGRRV